MDLQEMGWREYGLDLSCSEQGQVAGFHKSGHESSSSVKCGEFLN